ncbi:hypothetical protein GCM10010156_33790 [Planobispora rosea]|uniref:Peptidase C39-like domain-containing protein n=2 Tax=Planobispora rosea TaxID=35762 RepID=A0A8J3S8E1_PLARO|nr:hypothetical protein GCM10010156_33790 [Planobispora rosea]GIH85243.1 hypothetical protein Pro02_36510 [Planobispora rosea]
MILNYWGHATRISEVLGHALRAGAWSTSRLWLHSQLVTVLHNHGLAACRRNWRLLDGREQAYLAGRPAEGSDSELDWVKRQMMREGLDCLTRLLGLRVPVIVSVHRPFGAREARGHQVVLLGRGDGHVWYHDPAEREGRQLRLPVAAFMANWRGTAIIAAPRDHPALDPAPS